jgi:hypothetical protein
LLIIILFAIIIIAVGDMPSSKTRNQQMGDQDRARNIKAMELAKAGKKVKKKSENDDKIMTMAPDDNGNPSGAEEDEEVTCPLFMEGLPRNFDSNPHLAAIASLLEDTEEEGINEGVNSISKEPPSTHTTNPILLQVHPTGGGKVRRQSCRSSRSHKPYAIPKQESKKKSATIGEAQLFLNMWKL